MIKYNEYCCRYYHEGSWWGVNITARNFDDAEERVKKLGNLQLLGELQMTIPAGVPKAHWIVRLIVAIRNILSANVQDHGPAPEKKTKHGN